MDLVIVGGPHSGVGKTLAAEVAIRALKSRRVGAIKLTVADGERDPVHDHGASALAIADAAGICGRGASCGVCETVSDKIPSRLITNPRAISKSGTDTCRLSDAGAVAVAWVIALRSGAPQSIEAALAYLREAGARMTVIEGTTALEWLSPKASVMVVTDPGKSWKSVALRSVGSCDIVLRNHVPESPGNVPAPSELELADPIDCNLGDPCDPGAQAYVRRLLALVIGERI